MCKQKQSEHELRPFLEENPFNYTRLLDDIRNDMPVNSSSDDPDIICWVKKSLFRHHVHYTRWLRKREQSVQMVESLAKNRETQENMRFPRNPS